MSNIVYKDNNLVEASYSLNLSEQRLILIAIIAAREIEKELTSDTILTIHSLPTLPTNKPLMRKPTTSPVFSGCTVMVARGISTWAETENNPTSSVPTHNIGRFIENALRNRPIAHKVMSRGINLVLLTTSPIGTINSKPKA